MDSVDWFDCYFNCCCWFDIYWCEYTFIIMFKKINLTNKTALVTGAGKGLGKACAIALAEAGAKVIIISRTLSDLIKVEKYNQKN